MPGQFSSALNSGLEVERNLVGHLVDSAGRQCRALVECALDACCPTCRAEVNTVAAQACERCFDIVEVFFETVEVGRGMHNKNRSAGPLLDPSSTAEIRPTTSCSRQQFTIVATIVIHDCFMATRPYLFHGHVKIGALFWPWVLR